MNFSANRFLLVLPALALAAIAPAQTTPNKVGVIQIQAALAMTKDGQAALDSLDKRLVQPKRKEIEGKQAEMKDLQDQLQRGGNTMSQSRKDDLQRQIDQKTKNLQRDMQDAEEELQGEQNKIVQELMAKMQPIIDKYAQDNGYSMIVDVSNPNSGILWVATGIDITGAVVELYDKAAPATPAAKPGTSAVKPPSGAKPAVGTPSAVPSAIPARPPAQTAPPKPAPAK